MAVFKVGGNGRTRRLPLRTVLVILAVVPSVALAGVWALGTYQLGRQWQNEDAQRRVAVSVGGKTQQLLINLQKERRLSAEALADPSASRGDLTAQRALTDRAASTFSTLAVLDTSHAQAGLHQAVLTTVRQLAGLADQRRAVDDGSVSQQKAYDYYTGVVTADIGVVTALSSGVNGQVTTKAQTLVDLVGAVEMVSREDALLARGWKSGRLSFSAYDMAVDFIGTQEYLLEYRVDPSLTGKEAQLYRTLTTGQMWKSKQRLEEGLIRSVTNGTQGGQVTVSINHAEWRLTMDQVGPELATVLLARVNTINALSTASVNQLQFQLVAASALGLATVLLVIAASWRLIIVLRRRILTLRDEARELRTRLPDVVGRLERGEDVDVDAEVRAVEPSGDELGELAEALNLAARSAIATAVRQADQHRGFERLLQRIARRTQLLIGLQLKKLDQMERRHEDPAVLEGLFDLDHLTARLRRYEENLVILGGGQPQRRWRRPVQLLDLLRAAQGEVQDYQRISVEVEGRPWVSEWAVGALTHILAELMENAAAFSKPPTPVEVRAGVVGRGIAVEIEDRGLGMTTEQYADANALMQAPPQLDVMARADDARLGLYVVARLSLGLGVQVELRPSAFGGTRVIVLVPERYVAEPPEPLVKPRAGRRGDAGAPGDVPPQHSGPRPLNPDDTAAVARAQEEGRLPVRTRGRAMADVGADAGAGTEPDAAGGGPVPLPKRVRQAGLAPELREPDADRAPEAEEFTPHPEPRRSGATIGAFQRQSRRARTPTDALPHPSSPSTEDRQ
ncbi:sensor histidine kinase [Actinacidiphila soli]|uniref:sensor histidine kinase n=1 Tax=Actinacidiphila soli TaxID=2487275 RepID=UPI001F0CD75E|nr:nitrate- and nitrite sensing domain-containing protein [Actinacidiphila soli]